MLFLNCKEDVAITACTAAEEGVYLISGAEEKLFSAKNIDVVDSTGAGDSFAAGFLYGMIKGRDLNACSKLGNKIAEEVLKVYGPRIESNLIDLVSH